MSLWTQCSLSASPNKWQHILCSWGTLQVPGVLVWALEVFTWLPLLGVSQQAVYSVLWQEEVPFLQAHYICSYCAEAKPWHAVRVVPLHELHCNLPQVLYVIKILSAESSNLVTQLCCLILNLKTPCYYSKIFTSWVIWFLAQLCGVRQAHPPWLLCW